MRIRPLIALSAVALTGILLAGCTGTGTASPTASPSETVSADLCASAAKPGTASDAVKVEGDAGAEPKVTFTTPLETTAIERTVATEGTGDKIKEGDWVQYGIVAFNAQTGEKIGTAGYTEASALPVQVSAEGTGQFFGCATIGSRIVLALPGDESSPAQINVIDVLGVSRLKAWGADQPAVEGMPKVALAADGTPTITIPDSKAPTALKIAVLKKGDGPTVADGDYVLTQYTGTSWDTKENFDSSWKRGSPAPFYTNQVYEGFGKALVGQTVGSQVLVVMPPSLGDTSGSLKGQTLVFVIDILATQHVSATQ